jgi:hypothetical protein
MDGTHLMGRGWKAPVIRIDPSEDRIMVRMDDEKDPELWVTLYLSEAVLEEALKRLREHREED